MRLSDLFSFPRQLSPSWTYAPGSAIWRMLPTSEGSLVGESRDEEKKKVSFFCIDLRSGRPLWESVSVSEEWWVGIEAVHGDILFLHLFARPDMPEHAGLVAIDRSTGKVRWDRPYLQLRGLSDGHVIARDHRDPEGPLMALDAMTGVETGVTFREDGSALEEFADPAGVTYPAPIQDGDMFARALAPHLRRHHLIGSGEGVQVDDRWIISYHASEKPAGEAGSFHHRIIVLDQDGKRLFMDVLHEEAHMPVYDAFFVRNGRCYYIRKERELICVDVRREK